MTLPESPERAAANAASWSRNPKRCVIAGRDVQPRLEHHRHLVPGLVHLPAVDPPDRQQLEHDLVDVERDLLGRDAEDRDAAAVGHVVESAAERRRVAGHLEGDVEALDHAQLALDIGEVALARIDGDRRAHPRGQRAPDRVRLAHDDEPRPGMAGDGGRHQADRPGAGDRARPRPARGTRAPCARRCRTGRRSRPRPRRCPASDARRWSSAATTYSANAPSRPTPRPTMCAHRWRRPARQWRHSPQVTWPSPLTMSPGAKS